MVGVNRKQLLCLCGELTRHLKMYKEVGMACQSVHQQDKNEKVVYKAPSLHHLYSVGEKNVGMDKALYSTFTFISFLSCLHTFWHAIPTSL